MRLIINILLILGVAGLFYLLYSSIKEPISFQQVRDAREGAVVDKLVKIRSAQETYRLVTGQFAPRWDTLKQVLRDGKIQIISVTGDPDDPLNNTIVYDTTYESAMDQISGLDLNLDSLEYVPYGNGELFDISADTMTYQKTLVNVVEVGVSKAKFMGKYADLKYARYDDTYNPNEYVKFGSMSTPNLSGNWE